jgi:microcystin-dependent protein
MTTLFAGTAIPVGAVLPFAGPSTKVPDGYLLCNGAEVNRNDFAALFAEIGTFWGHGNTATTFNLPTTQGLLLRGVAYGSGNDPDRDTRNAVLAGGQTGDEVGSFQNWRVEAHRHLSTVVASEGESAVNTRTQLLGNAALNNSAIYNGVLVGSPFSNSNTTSSTFALMFNGNAFTNSANSNLTLTGGRVASSITGSNQTIGQNVYMNFIIKY